MALSIRASALHSGQIVRPNNEPQSLLRNNASEFSNLNVSSAGAGEDKVEVKPSRESGEERTSMLLLSSSIALTRKEAVASELISTTDELLKKALDIRTEPNAMRRIQLKEDAQNIQASISAEYNAALVENPSLDQEETVTTPSVDPDADLKSSGRSYTARIAPVASPEALGMTALSFEPADIDNTIQSLQDIQTSLSTTAASMRSTGADMAEVIRHRGAAEAASQLGTTPEGIEQRARSLADEIRRSVTIDSLPPISASSGRLERLVSAEEVIDSLKPAQFRGGRNSLIPDLREPHKLQEHSPANPNALKDLF